MSKNPPPAAPLRNRLLAALPAADYESLLSHLKPVHLESDTVLYESRGPIRHAYFAVGGVFSALTVMQDGNLIEVATVGNEGLAGHASAFGDVASPNKVIVQIGGGALRLEAAALRREVARSGSLRDLLIGYQATFMAQVSQSVACNGLHRLQQRCCRWLLMSRDRVGSDDLRLTHEYLGVMLGARRASVTAVLKPLQSLGLPSSVRGRVVILDGAGLESLACECYGVVKAEYDRLLGVPSCES